MNITIPASGRLRAFSQKRTVRVCISGVVAVLVRTEIDTEVRNVEGRILDVAMNCIISHHGEDHYPLAVLF